MSLVQPPAPERRPSPAGELGTNNPFRARLSGVPDSPASTSERFSFASGNGRSQSRNPFLDVFDDDSSDFPNGPGQGRFNHRASSFDSSSQQRSQLSGSAAELFENLTVTDDSRNMSQGTNRPADKGSMRPPPPRPHQTSGPRPRPPPPPGHQHSMSAADEPLISIGSESTKPGPRRPAPPDRSRNGDRSRDHGERRRPRRNSDSSVMDVHEADNRDRLRAERRHRDHKSSRDGSGKSRREGSSDRRKRNPALDVIDKLDVTGIYGPGLFHHDGPFDACNPHRNKSTRRLAPVQAFPEDSANNSMAGSGPLNPRPDHAQLFGDRDPEAFNDYTHTTVAAVRPSGNRAVSFDPKTASEPIHGDESYGLGTSTFLDGAPASRAAMQRTLSESDDRPASSSEVGGFGGGGLARKKSLAQRFRGLGQNRSGGSGTGGGAIADGPIAGRRRAPPPPGQRSPAEDRFSPTTPGDSSTPTGNEKNPFFTDYSDVLDRKGESISVVGRDRAPSSSQAPSPGIERAGTDKSSNENGLLKRVRSLSKPKRRNE